MCQSDWPMSEYRSFFNLSFSLRANLGRENRNSFTPSSDASIRICRYYVVSVAVCMEMELKAERGTSRNKSYVVRVGQ